MPASLTTFRLVLVCLDVVILLYRVTHVCRVVNRMRKGRSRGHRKYYGDYEGDDDGDDDYWSSARERTRQDLTMSAGRSGLDQVDEALYQLSPSSSSTSTSCSESGLVCRVVQSSFVTKLVLFMTLITLCHVALQIIGSSRLSAHIDHMTLPADSALPRLDSDVQAVYSVNNSALPRLDFDIQAVYSRQRQYTATSFNAFVVSSLSHLSIMVQLIADGNSVLFHSSYQVQCEPLPLP